jgi:hypothetical protein
MAGLLGKVFAFNRPLGKVLISDEKELCLVIFETTLIIAGWKGKGAWLCG